MSRTRTKKMAMAILLSLTVVFGIMGLAGLKTAQAAETAPRNNVRITEISSIPDGTGGLQLKTVFDVDSTVPPYNGNYTWVARTEPGVFNYIKLNGTTLTRDEPGTVFDVHQYTNTFVVQKAYPEGTTITYEKGMGLVKANGFTENSLTGDTLGYTYTFTLQGGAWTLTVTDDPGYIFSGTGRHSMTDDAVVLETDILSAMIADGAVSGSEVSKIKLNTISATAATVEEGTLKLTFPRNAFQANRDHLVFEANTDVNGTVFQDGYEAYYLDYAGKYVKTLPADIEKSAPVEFLEVRKDTTISPQWGTHQQILLDFDMSDNVTKDFYNFESATNIAGNDYVSLANLLQIDGKALKDCTNMIGGDGIYVHYRPGTVELYVKSDWFGAEIKEHTVLIKEGFLFPNGKYLQSDVLIRFTPSAGGISGYAVSYEIGTAGIELAEEMTIYYGKKEKLAAVLTPSNATDRVEWTVQDPTVAEILEDGTVRGLKVGETTLTAAAGGKTATMQLKVVNAIASLDIPENKVVAMGAPHGLPGSISATLSDGTKITGTVEWDATDYNPDAAGTYEIGGTFTPDESYPFEDGVSAQFTVEISILDLSALETAVENAEEFLANHSEEDYTTLSWQNLSQKKAAAEALILKGQSEYVSQEEVSAAAQDLAYAIEHLVLTSIVADEPVGSAEVKFGEDISEILPEKVTVEYDNGSSAELAVDWGEIPSADRVGSLTVSGTVVEKDGTECEIEFTVVVTNFVRQVKNKPTDKEVSFGAAHGLPSTVTLVFADGSEQNASVSWSGDYNANIAGVYALTGNITSDFEFENEADAVLTVRVTVAEKAAENDTPGGCGCGKESAAGMALLAALLIGLGAVVKFK